MRSVTLLGCGKSRQCLLQKLHCLLSKTSESEKLKNSTHKISYSNHNFSSKFYTLVHGKKVHLQKNVCPRRALPLRPGGSRVIVVYWICPFGWSWLRQCLLQPNILVTSLYEICKGQPYLKTMDIENCAVQYSLTILNHINFWNN